MVLPHLSNCLPSKVPRLRRRAPEGAFGTRNLISVRSFNITVSALASSSYKQLCEYKFRSETAKRGSDYCRQLAAKRILAGFPAKKPVVGRRDGSALEGLQPRGTLELL
jgi:hypothetical protein